MPELQRINIIAYTTAAEEGAMYDGPSFTNISLEEMKALYEGWEEEVQVIIEVIFAFRAVPKEHTSLTKLCRAYQASHVGLSSHSIP